MPERSHPSLSTAEDRLRQALGIANDRIDSFLAGDSSLGDLRSAAEALILSRKGWERWGPDAFLYDRYQGVGTGTVYSTADALRKIAGAR